SIIARGRGPIVPIKGFRATGSFARRRWPAPVRSGAVPDADRVRRRIAPGTGELESDSLGRSGEWGAHSRYDVAYGRTPGDGFLRPHRRALRKSVELRFLCRT